MSYAETSEFLKVALPVRRFDSRKGQNGVSSIIGGSEIYHGAPALAALAAYRTGIDLVYLFVPQAVATAVRAISPSLIVHPFPGSRLTTGCAVRILARMPPVDSCVLGPGAGKQKPAGMRRIARELASRKVGLVIDADALQSEVVRELGSNRVVLTPHPGEFKRITGIELTGSTGERVEAVRRTAKSLGVTILVKGYIDIISDGGRVAVDRAGSPAMTVGEIGDVLSGIVGALLAKGAEPFAAAAAAAYITGKCGEMAAEKVGMRILPTDLIEELPAILKRYDVSLPATSPSA